MADKILHPSCNFWEFYGGLLFSSGLISVNSLSLIARYILTTSHTKMAPTVCEAILFLHINCALWDEKTVMEALVAVRADQKVELLKNKLQLADDQEQIEAGDESGDDNEE
jgi:hypothetical protein